MVVVGGRHSANTKELTRLCQIGRHAGRSRSRTPATSRTPRRSRAPASSGVTGGTSTPVEDLREVAERIFAIAGHARACGPGPPSSPTPPSTPRPRPAGRTTSLPRAIAPAGAAR